jgi:hypothetical protein
MVAQLSASVETEGREGRMLALATSWDSFGGPMAGRAASSSVYDCQVAGVT